MRREHIELRNAARRGDPRACLAMGERLFTGTQGFVRNPRLALAYLQQELSRGSHPAMVLVADHAPLELLVMHRLHACLSHAAAQGCSAAAGKLAVWRALREGDPRTGALLQDAPPDWLEPGAAALACAREALAGGQPRAAWNALRTASHFVDASALAEPVCAALEAAALARAPIELPVDLVEQALALRSVQGDPCAQYLLGCAYAGHDTAGLAWPSLVRQPHAGRAAALLLRAADGGVREAWLRLARLDAPGRALLGGQDAARFFLEKAAREGVVEAQARLGIACLREAACLRDAERAMPWLDAAAGSGDASARAALGTLVLPIAELPPANETRMLERIAALDRDLGVRVMLARALHLTRHEALSLHPARDLRPWGLVLPGSAKENPKGRVAPATTPAMRKALARAREFWGEGAVLEGTLVLQRARAQKRVFELLGLSEATVFAANIGRSWTHYGFGKHWAARTGQASGARRGAVVDPWPALSDAAHAAAVM